MWLYKLFLTKDNRPSVPLSYEYVIGRAFWLRKYYIRKVRLWDPWLKAYEWEKVLFKVTGRQGMIILLEVSDGTL